MVPNTVTLLSLLTIVLVLSICLKGTVFNLASGQAVPLIPLRTGNLTLDREIPLFYKCIQKEVKSSTNANDDPYFKSEPTKEEVFKCYNSIFVGPTQKNTEIK
jgi:hypothetical protein